MVTDLSREQLIQNCKRLQLDRVPRGVREEHSGLLTGLSFKPRIGLDYKIDLVSQPFCEFAPGRQIKHKTKVSNRHFFVIDPSPACSATILGGEVRNDLVSKEIEIDPMLTAAPFGAAE